MASFDFFFFNIIFESISLKFTWNISINTFFKHPVILIYTDSWEARVASCNVCHPTGHPLTQQNHRLHLFDYTIEFGVFLCWHSGINMMWETSSCSNQIISILLWSVLMKTVNGWNLIILLSECRCKRDILPSPESKLVRTVKYQLKFIVAFAG